jgi:hypothetical protein
MPKQVLLHPKQHLNANQLQQLLACHAPLFLPDEGSCKQWLPDDAVIQVC